MINRDAYSPRNEYLSIKILCWGGITLRWKVAGEGVLSEFLRSTGTELFTLWEFVFLFSGG